MSSTPKSHAYGFIGLGAMGYPMAASLVKVDRSEVPIVYNRTVEVAERHAREHGTA